jgi:hypothetical protein
MPVGEEESIPLLWVFSVENPDFGVDGKNNSAVEEPILLRRWGDTESDWNLDMGASG